MRIVVLAMLLSLPLVLTSGASALDLCEEAQCQPPGAEQNTPYEFRFVAEEGCLPYRFEYLNGTVPPGLGITEDGKLVGTPTEAGEFQFWVGLDDNSGPDNPYCQVPSVQSQARFTLLVMPDLAVTTESLPVAVPGQPYQVQLQFSNPEVGWTVVWDVTQGSLPQGLSLSEGGVISGTPVGPDVRQFVVRAREPFRRSGERPLTLTVASTMTASSSSPRIGEVGLLYSGSVSAHGGTQPYSWNVAGGALPSGLTLDQASGTIRGVPIVSGSFSAQLGVRDATGQAATVVVGIRIAARLMVATERLPSTSAGHAYAARLRTSGGLQPVRWSVVRGALPRGMRLDRVTGMLTGTARRTGVYRFTAQGVDRLGVRARKGLRLVVVL